MVPAYAVRDDGLECAAPAMFSRTHGLWIAPEWATPDFAAFLRHLPMEPTGLLITRQRNHLTRHAADAARGIRREIVIKDYRLRRKYDHLRYCLLPSKARRALQGADILRGLGLDTPRPVALLEVRGACHRLVRSLLVTEYLDGPTLLTAEDWAPARPWLPVLGREMRRLHDAGYLHGDFHGGNLLFHDTVDGPRFSYLDLNRVRYAGALTPQQRADDLARFVPPRADQRAFLQGYAPDYAHPLYAFYHQACRRRQHHVDRRRQWEVLLAGL